jgi:hypothetical protein
LATADKHDPGAEFTLKPGERRIVEINIQLTSQDPISNIEVIHNGTVTHTIQCSREMTQSHTVQLPVDGPGWFLLRAIADVENTFRFAATAPWYIETDETKHRISRKSVQFFVDWVSERIDRVHANLHDRAKRDQVLLWHLRARKFWMDRLKTANAP